MRQIERLRGRSVAWGPSYPTPARTARSESRHEVAALDQQLRTPHGSCVEMPDTVEKMRARLGLRSPGSASMD